MIHLVLREPMSYHRTLCRTLHDSYTGAFVAWFDQPRAERFPSQASAGDHYQQRFLSETGYRELFRALKNDPQALIILGGWSSPMTNRTLLLATLLRVPIFIWADHPHPRQRSWLKDRARKAYLGLISRMVSGFLVCGRPTVQHLNSLGIPLTRIIEFPYWVDVPTQWTLPGGSNVSPDESGPLKVLALGRLVPVKQFEIAIQAVGLVNRKGGRQVAQLRLVGDGPEREKLGAQARALSSGSIQLCGWLEGESLFQQIESADVLVLPSKFDAYGVVVLEAMARGRPVLASDRVMAAVDRADRTAAISLHPAGDVECLARQIECFVNDRGELRRAAFAARVIAEQWKPERAASILDRLLLGISNRAKLIPNRDDLSASSHKSPPNTKARTVVTGR